MQNILLNEDIELLINDIKCKIKGINEWLELLKQYQFSTLATREFNTKRIKQYKEIIKFLKTLKNGN